MISFQLESHLRCRREDLWNWITSLEGISKEMRPYFRMTAPRNVRSIADVEIGPGKRLFRSYVFLFGFLPIDYSDLTLIEFQNGRGFVEESPMGSMKKWRHERRILDSANDPNQVTLLDKLTFEPKFAQPLVGWFIRRVFEHRHDVLKKQFGGANR